MTTIKYHVGVLRRVASDLDKLGKDGSLYGNEEDVASAFDRIASASRVIFGSADFFDGLAVGLIAGGIISDDGKCSCEVKE